MTDAVGQSLEIGNFVTAIWANAEVALFEVVGFKENTRVSSTYWKRRGDVVILKRLFNDEVSEKTQNKPVKKLITQVTKVPDDAVRDAVVMFKLAN
jgi:hypothetical protein